ncbi:hypothetical protein vseg_010800 [Gypsophila vaccaria]
MTMATTSHLHYSPFSTSHRHRHCHRHRLPFSNLPPFPTATVSLRPHHPISAVSGGNSGNVPPSNNNNDKNDNNNNNDDDDNEEGSSIWGIFMKGWKERVKADPQFPFKVIMEEVVGMTSCILGDMASRPNFGLHELDLVFSTLVVGSILNFTLMYLLAPTPAAASAAAGFFPSHVFQPGRYGVGARAGSLVYKGAVFAVVGFVAGLVGTGIGNGLMAVRKKGKKAPPMVLNAVTWAGHMGLSSNLRYQTLNGVECALEKAVSPGVFKVAVVMLRCANNLLGGVTFVALARLTGSQSVGGGGGGDKVEEVEAEEEKVVVSLPSNRST